MNQLSPCDRISCGIEPRLLSDHQRAEGVLAFLLDPGDVPFRGAGAAVHDCLHLVEAPDLERVPRPSDRVPAHV